MRARSISANSEAASTTTWTPRARCEFSTSPRARSSTRGAVSTGRVFRPRLSSDPCFQYSVSAPPPSRATGLPANLALELATKRIVIGWILRSDPSAGLVDRNQVQGSPRTLRHGAMRVLDEIVGDGSRIEDRVAPVVQPDALGKQLGADAVRLTGDGVNPKPLFHRHPGGSTGVGRSGGSVASRDGPWRRGGGRSSGERLTGP